MSRHLLLLSLGPVQTFIAQARRTRDLWFGSHLLSELAKTAAKDLVREGAEIVFPYIGEAVERLDPLDSPFDRHGRPAFSVPNRLLAVVPDGIEPERLARSCRTAVRDRWQTIARDVREHCRPIIAGEVDSVWDDQIDEALEFLATWCPFDPEDPGSYATRRRELFAELAARKSLRDFRPWRERRKAAPKSSLDGARVSVLRETESRTGGLWRQFRISQGEQLDAVGLVKRAGGDPEQFVPLANVAVARWLRRIDRLYPAELEGLRRAAAQVRIPRIDRGELGWVECFPYDAQAIHLERLVRLVEEDEVSIEDPKTWHRENVAPLLRAEGVGAPPVYLACLVADGDRMGELFDASNTIEQHRELSAALSSFAEHSRQVVEQDHDGVLVYAGGDDVLAFICLDDAFTCADALRKAFAQTVSEAAPSHRQPTLSVGLGIGHYLESMGHLLDLGRRAEKTAKGAERPESERRNALAVLVDKRSGGLRSWRSQWSADPVGRLKQDQELRMSGDLSRSKVYEIDRVLRRFPRPKALGTESGIDALATVIRGEVTRALGRSQLDSGEGIGPESVGLLWPVDGDYGDTWRAVYEWVSRAVVASNCLPAGLAEVAR